MKSAQESVSALQWGSLPEGWTVRRLKFVASLGAGQSITSDDIEESGAYPVYGGNGVRGYCDAYTHEGSFPLIGRQGALCGNVVMAEGRFWASEHAVVTRPGPETNARWLGHVLTAMDLNQYSMSAAQPGLSVGVIRNLWVPYPTAAQQRGIAAFLDRETARIDGLVEKKLRLLELLDERWSSLVSAVVTRGLAPHVPTKESGVEWLGRLPDSWETRRLKYLVSEPLKYGANEPAVHENSDWPRYVRITDVGPDGRLRDGTFKSLPPSTARPFLLQQGDVLFARSGATVGKTFLYSDAWGVCAYAGYLIRARSNPGLLEAAYLKYFTESSPYRQWLGGIFSQATIQNVSAEKYAGLVLPVPSLAEQRDIVAYLDAEAAKLDAIKAATNRIIDLLAEHRTSLITAAVTGTIDVSAS